MGYTIMRPVAFMGNFTKDFPGRVAYAYLDFLLETLHYLHYLH